MNYKILFTVIAVVAGAITLPALKIFRHVFSVPKSCADLVYRHGLFGDS